jgi:hypothetical protein
MKRAGAAILAVSAGLFAANMLGVAVAEAPTTVPVRTVSVQGVAILPIGSTANAAAATAVYREGMAAAVADGQSKAEFLTGKVSATLGAPINIVEDGGYINCSGGGESEYAEYEGEQPDFGVARGPAVTTSSPEGTPPRAAPLSSTVKAKRPRHKRRITAKKATAASCKLTAQVSLTYTIG